ncbi:MAG: hypothetical protein JO007_16010 [Alphaproteobacteria bacterium]|nr:hypothetical protein [Alphaproteobacteria bacterium]
MPETRGANTEADLVANYSLRHREGVMSDETEGRCGFSRRLLLQGAVVSIGAAAGIVESRQPAGAAPKISKAAVAYQDHPEGDKHCSKCRQFVAPDSCKVIDGLVSPQGFCRIFMPLGQALQPLKTAPATG